MACIAGVLLFYAGFVLALHLGTSSAGPEASAIGIMFGLGYGVLWWSSVAAFILAIVYLATAVGLFLSRLWAWILSIILSIVSIGLNLDQEVMLYPTGLFGWLSLLIAFGVPVYLTRPRVRHFFRALAKVS